MRHRAILALSSDEPRQASIIQLRISQHRLIGTRVRHCGTNPLGILETPHVSACVAAA